VEIISKNFNYLLEWTLHFKIDIFLKQVIKDVYENIQHSHFVKSTQIERLINESSIVFHVDSLNIDPWIFQFGCHVKF
jgi:hypothetical protein